MSQEWLNNKTVKLIACCDVRGLIGYNGKIPWYNKTDLKRFKELTMNSTLIVGHETYKSLPPLKGREISVLRSMPVCKYCNSTSHNTKDCITSFTGRSNSTTRFYHSIIDAVKESNTDNVWIAGGAKIYKETLLLHLPEEIDLTIINGIIVTDIKDGLYESIEKSTYLPEISYFYQVISETQNEEDKSLWHRKYVIREPWNKG